MKAHKDKNMNILQVYLQSILLLLFFSSVQLSAEENLTSDWLNAATGSAGEIINAEVVNIQQVDDTTVIDIKILIDDLASYETIEIIDKNTKKPAKLTQKPRQLIDENEEPYGVRFQIKRIPGFEFRIELRDDTDQLLP